MFKNVLNIIQTQRTIQQKTIQIIYDVAQCNSPNYKIIALEDVIPHSVYEKNRIIDANLVSQENVKKTQMMTGMVVCMVPSLLYEQVCTVYYYQSPD